MNRIRPVIKNPAYYCKYMWKDGKTVIESQANSPEYYAYYEAYAKNNGTDPNAQSFVDFLNTCGIISKIAKRYMVIQ